MIELHVSAITAVFQRSSRMSNPD